VENGSINDAVLFVETVTKQNEYDPTHTHPNLSMKWKSNPINPPATVPTYPENSLGIIAVHDVTLSPTEFSRIVDGPLTAAEPKLIEEISKPLDE